MLDGGATRFFYPIAKERRVILSTREDVLFLLPDALEESRMTVSVWFGDSVTLDRCMH